MTRNSKEMRHVYRDFLKEANNTHKDLLVLEADLSSSMSTNSLAADFGKRYINLGIMEAQMVGLAAGLSVKGFHPYVHTFGPFASRRVFDQLFVSLGYAQLKATIVGSDAGVTAEMNGGTHMPFEELGLIRLIPKATVFEVSDDIQFEAVLKETLDLEGLSYIRTTRKAPKPIYDGQEDFKKGYITLRPGEDIVVVASGIMVAEAMEVIDKLAEEGIKVGLIDLFRIKPLPEDLKEQLIGKTILTFENHNVIGGIGSAISDLLSQETQTPIFKMGVQESFGQVGQKDYLLDHYGLSQKHLYQKLKDLSQN
ncbi:transketolase family protein [Streptococcus uberis]|uniref:transketolase family protein n=1 Tax=Streptococcus uberis TaxID=1349 RepID=UPI0018E19548|nr:transketolase C-terminal domain-containing protein [Streptococcus uberis]MBI0906319.1 transketolase family protein [Streptococcus uberis]MCK1195125.1 transketolase family protein [Streptococcus uberis]MCK1199001.1 transketolase family protein [Streptococcus uberis]MCK1236822.1 transketolase family protein [Streptococcus uberis]